MLLVAETSNAALVDLDVPGWAWIGLLLAIVLLLAVDLYRHRDAHAPTTREAAIESAIWVACGLGFAAVVGTAFGGQAFGEYISGYLIEKSLSVDNVFVWAMLFSTLAIPVAYQHRVLFWGIFGALALRAGFIFAGTALVSRFWWLLLVFGVFLVFTGIKVVRHKPDEGSREARRGIGLLRKIMPVSDELHGQRFLTRIDGRLVATPLFAAVIVIEMTDVIFAVDSVPAILAVSRAPFLVFASNAFAILGLRAMYFLLANAKQRFHYLSHGLGAILVFVGLKMAVSHWYHLNTYVSLGVIVAMLAAAIVLSERRTRALRRFDTEAAASDDDAGSPSSGRDRDTPTAGGRSEGELSRLTRS
ncbi:MAG TPA: TerC family protein [Acidimicrobiia bacterium]|nr:TerC family protein [Acidimicrobiia bacterium]